jgi:hypothetical protein
MIAGPGGGRGLNGRCVPSREALVYNGWVGPGAFHFALQFDSFDRASSSRLEATPLVSQMAGGLAVYSRV